MTLHLVCCIPLLSAVYTAPISCISYACCACHALDCADACCPALPAVPGWQVVSAVPAVPLGICTCWRALHALIVLAVLWQPKILLLIALLAASTSTID